MRYLPHILMFLLPLSLVAQEKEKNKWIKFEAILDGHIGWQGGVTLQNFAGGENVTDSTISNYKAPKLGVDLSLGGSVREILFLGIGAGYDRQFAGNGRQQQDNAKVFGHLRIHLFRARFRPFIGMKGGYQYRQLANSVTEVHVDRLRYDGVFMQPELGLSIKLNKHALINLALNYEYKRMADRFDTVWTDLSGNTLEETGSYLKHQDHYVNFVLGFTFH